MMILEGIRVIDWTIWQQGPVATTMLADMGAEVIKVEHPTQGDPARGVRKQLGVPLTLHGGRTAIFEHNNRNKKSIAIDLTIEKGKEIIYQLVGKSDVFVHNWRADVPERLGLDYDTLKKFNPRLIYANASGYGPKGPERLSPSLDPIGQARSGFMWNVGEPAPFPQTSAPGFIDQMGAILLSYGILGALLARERLGIGQQVHASLLGSGIALQSLNITVHLLTGRRYLPNLRQQAPNPIYNYYECKDNKWIFFALVQSERFWPDFCQALGCKDLEMDPRFSNTELREQNSKELIEIFDKIFTTKTYEEWNQRLSEVSKDFIYTRVQDYDDLSKDPQVLENSYIIDYDHPTLGKVKMTGFPVTFSQTPAAMRMPAPEHGQHTEEILTEVCGYSWEDIPIFKKQGVIP